MANSCFGTMYTVRPGDTLWSISKNSGISVERIIEANPNVNPQNLQSGQQICIPSNCQGNIYTTRPGDTFWSISRAHGINVDRIIAANPSINPQNLQTGMQICIPTDGTVTPPTPNCQGTLYTFRSGDSLWRIAQQHGISVNEILAANPNLNPNNIQIGQQICIPTTQVTPPNNYIAEVVRLCNVERQKAGLAPLTSSNSGLQQAANLRASEIRQNFSHIRPNGTNFSSVLGQFGVSYSAAGENIAYGQRTPQEVVNSWMNSQGHRANILNPNFNQIAVGLDGTHWVQLFIRG